MRHLAPRLDGESRKGTWWRAAGKTMWGCPNCGQAHVLSPHRVLSDGEVQPSVVCAQCGFHDHVTLEEVSPEAVTAIRARHTAERGKG